MVVILSFGEAIADDTCALTLDRENAYVRFRRAQTALRTGRLPLALSDAQKCVNFQPDNTDFASFLADVRKVCSRKFKQNIRKNNHEKSKSNI
jgi:hypothetical protein